MNLEIQWGDSQGFFVSVEPGTYLDENNDAQAWAGGEIDLRKAMPHTPMPSKTLVLIGISNNNLVAYVGTTVDIQKLGPANGTYFSMPNIVAAYNAAGDGVFWVACVPILSTDMDLSDAPNRATPLWELSLGASGTDEKVKVSSSDTTPGFLADKLVSGSGILLLETDGILEISNVGGIDSNLVIVSGDDTTPGDLEGKIVAGNAITLSTLNPSGDEDLQINVVESAISHTNITNIGTNTHIQIDSHIASTSNPHNVTAAQVGAASNGQLKVSSDDTTFDYLFNKLVAGTGIALTELNSGANEDVQIAVADNYVLNTGDIMTGSLVIDGSSDVQQLTVQGHSSQTNPIMRVEDSTATAILLIQTGLIQSNRRLLVDGTANEVQCTIQGHSTQTNHLLLVENSAGDDKIVIDQNFRLGINTNAPSDLLSVNAGKLRFTTTAGGDASHSTLQQSAAGQLNLDQIASASASEIDLNPRASNGFLSTVRLFDQVSTTANEQLLVYGAGSIQHRIAKLGVIFNDSNLDCDFRVSGTTTDLLFHVDAGGNNIGINTGTPAASAALEIAGTTGALLLPRLTTAQRDALTAVNGMIIYNTTTGVIEGREGGAWVNL